MICEKCGQWIDEGNKTCSKCGAPVGTDNAQNAGAGQPNMSNINAGFNAGAGQPGPDGYGMNGMPGGQAPMTKDQFYRHPNIASVKSQIVGAGIICYIVAGLNLVLSFIAGTFFATIVDVLLIVGMGLGIHLARSRVCAIILTVYGALNMIIMTIQQETLSGWWILLAGIYAIIYTFKYQGAWAEYLKTGVVKDFTPANKRAK